MEILDAIARDAAVAAHPTLKGKCEEAIARLRAAIRKYRGGLALSFNGGKDSTVILHLLRAALAQDRIEREAGDPSASTLTPPLSEDVCVFFFARKDDFPEITAFVDATAGEYIEGAGTSPGAGSVGVDDDGEGGAVHLPAGARALLRFPWSCPFKRGLQSLVSEGGVKAVVLGTRQGDPNAHGQGVECPSSAGWPEFVRLNPIIDWEYSEVWAFLLMARVPYCMLYDMGYTSIGGTKDTHKNPALIKQSDRGGQSPHAYWPAHKLEVGTREREGRA